MTDGVLEGLEARVEVRLGLPAATALGMLRGSWVVIGDDRDALPVPVEQLSKDPEYVEFARQTLAFADSRLAAIHDGTEPFVADKAFTAPDARVIERAALVALTLDAGWAEPIPRILGRAAIAPQAGVKSAPSQAAAFALARAIMAAPTPEAVAGLADATRDARHAGIKKKFTRYTREARRAIGRRPDVALRLPSETPTKAQLTTWTKALEAGWLACASWPYQTWFDAAFAAPVAGISARLVWQTGEGAEGQTFLGGPDGFADAAGDPVVVASTARIRLWHPAAANPAQRDAWRRRVRGLQLVQPIAQAFREHYTVADVDRLIESRALLNVRQLTGLYRAEGWVDDGHETISRRVGLVGGEIQFDGPVYPGSGLETCTATSLRVGALGVAADGHVAIADGCDDLAAVSEVLRSADLILSASTVAIEGASEADHTTQSPAGVLATRRVILEHILADLKSVEQIRFAGKHLEVNEFRVSLATGRVRRDGDLVDITPTKGHGLWQPTADRLLTTIVGTIVALLETTPDP